MLTVKILKLNVAVFLCMCLVLVVNPLFVTGSYHPQPRFRDGYVEPEAPWPDDGDSDCNAKDHYEEIRCYLP